MKSLTKLKTATEQGVRANQMISDGIEESQDYMKTEEGDC